MSGFENRLQVLGLMTLQFRMELYLRLFGVLGFGLRILFYLFE